jgi:anti-sigma B factor antagonist
VHELEIRDREINGVLIVSPSGSIDAASAPALTEHIHGVIAAGHVNLVADFSAVDYTSSAGLRVLLGAVKDTRAKGGDIRLAAVQPDVLKILGLSGFTSILKLYDDVDSAVGSFA